MSAAQSFLISSPCHLLLPVFFYYFNRFCDWWCKNTLSPNVNPAIISPGNPLTLVVCRFAAIYSGLERYCFCKPAHFSEPRGTSHYTELVTVALKDEGLGLVIWENPLKSGCCLSSRGLYKSSEVEQFGSRVLIKSCLKFAFHYCWNSGFTSLSGWESDAMLSAEVIFLHNDFSIYFYFQLISK